MKKSKALTLAILSTMCTIVSLTNEYPVLALCFIAPAILFWGIFIYKYQRDTAIISKAKAQRERHQQTPQLTQTITNKRSNGGLFVPPPINDHE